MGQTRERKGLNHRYKHAVDTYVEVVVTLGMLSGLATGATVILTLTLPGLVVDSVKEAVCRRLR